ncbi:formate-dependent nitrite reductase complex subunit NrfG [Salmonella enterica subsp. enterica serovar Enteritidis str. 76-2651]|nr:formate-dependent nitrite reductase complex subunit NrfG [Salmonella enterica subsp. enterica serovar Enteritidis str. 22558]ELO82516.1 formate-dependent nitrite reductase complex subunit NrfG [Salmonella enterica subsp. enterica serovar Enteritidis str. 76-2651]SUG85403.1 formate-dependent nitrite reductase complex subunit NrfG [Salmonella enterica subsp. enterica]
MSQSEHSTVPLRPMPVKRLAAAAVLMVAACVGGYLLTPKWQAVRSEQQRLADPLRDFTNPQTPEAQLSRLQEKSAPIRRIASNGRGWASIISIAMRMTMRCWHIVRRCVCEAITRSFSPRWQRCCITRPGNI